MMKRFILKTLWITLLSFLVLVLPLQAQKALAGVEGDDATGKDAANLAQMVKIRLKVNGAVYLHYDDTSQLDYVDNVTWRPDVPDTFDPKRFSNFKYEFEGNGSCGWDATKNELRCTGDINKLHVSYDYWYIPAIQDATFTFQYQTGTENRNVDLTLDLEYASEVVPIHFIQATSAPATHEKQTLHWNAKYYNDFGLQITFGHACDPIVTGICVISDRQHFYIAVVDLTNPDIKVELAKDLVDPASGRFRVKTVEDFVSENSGSGLNGNVNHYYVAINGTAKSDNFASEVYSEGAILGIDKIAYGSECSARPNCIDQPLASFFQFNADAQNPVRMIHRSGKETGFPHDPTDTDTAQTYILDKIGKATFVVGYQATILDTITPDGKLIADFPAYVVGDATDPNLNDEKTALGISADRNRLFLATVDSSVAVDQLARLLLAAGTARAILLDGGWSTQFASFARDQVDRNYTAKKCFVYCLVRRDINSIVVYNALVGTKNEFIIPVIGGVYALAPNMQLIVNSNTFISPATLVYTPQFPTNVSADEYRHVNRFYEIQATYADGTAAQPSQPYTIYLAYDQSSVPIDANEEQLHLYFWNGAAWEVEPTSTVNVFDNLVTATPSHFSRWAILTEPVALKQVYLPMIMR